MHRNIFHLHHVPYRYSNSEVFSIVTSYYSEVSYLSTRFACCLKRKLFVSAGRVNYGLGHNLKKEPLQAVPFCLLKNAPPRKDVPTVFLPLSPIGQLRLLGALFAAVLPAELIHGIFAATPRRAASAFGSAFCSGPVR